MREIVLDTETTGLSHKNGDRIIEVGCVEMINHIATKNTLQFYCRVDKKMSEDAVKITGITNDFLKDKKTFEEQHLEFLNFIRDDNLIIHNADFDIGFLNNELKLIGKKNLTNKITDTVSLARSVLNTRIANLDYLCRHFNIDLSKRSLHGALLDAQLLSEVYLELKGGKQFTMELVSRKKTKKSEDKKNKNNKQKIVKLIVEQESISKHKLMAKNIKSSLWEKFDY